MTLTKLFCRKQKKHDWDYLKRVEKKRRTRLLYKDQDTHGYRIIFRHINGTIITAILDDPLFWITMAVFVGFRFVTGIDRIVESEGVKSISTFMSLILAFFINQSRQDYNASYKVSMQSKGKIIEMATLAKSVLPEERAHQLVRRMNAAHLVGYTCLSDTYTRRNFLDPFNEEMQVLKPHELSRLDSIDSNMTNGGNTYTEIVSWAMDDIQTAMQDGCIDPRMASTLRSTLLGFRTSMAQMFNKEDQPTVTFFYFHLISLLCCIYLPLFAMNEAHRAREEAHLTPSDFGGALVVCVQCFYVIGMRSLAVKLMNPYDDDIDDLSVMTFIRTGWKASNTILNTKVPTEAEGIDFSA